MEDVVIVAGVRTPVGKFQGSLSDFSAVQLGSLVVREVLNRARDVYKRQLWKRRPPFVIPSAPGFPTARHQRRPRVRLSLRKAA